MSHDRTLSQLESDYAGLVLAADGDQDPAATPMTMLEIGDECAVVLSGQGDTPTDVRQLDIGAARIARDYFRHDPPTPREIELAIDFVEDEIMRMSKPHTLAATLWSTSPALQPWRAVADAAIPIETVEQWFQRLASAALGQPGALRGLPSGREAAAALLVLREFMHHRGHATIFVASVPGSVESPERA